VAELDLRRLALGPHGGGRGSGGGAPVGVAAVAVAVRGHFAVGQAPHRNVLLRRQVHPVLPLLRHRPTPQILDPREIQNHDVLQRLVAVLVLINDGGWDHQAVPKPLEVADFVVDPGQPHRLDELEVLLFARDAVERVARQLVHHFRLHHQPAPLLGVAVHGCRVHWTLPMPRILSEEHGNLRPGVDDREAFCA
jgi:hypothetical protein